MNIFNFPLKDYELDEMMDDLLQIHPKPKPLIRFPGVAFLPFFSWLVGLIGLTNLLAPILPLAIALPLTGIITGWVALRRVPRGQPGRWLATLGMGLGVAAIVFRVGLIVYAPQVVADCDPCFRGSNWEWYFDYFTDPQPWVRWLSIGLMDVFIAGIAALIASASRQLSRTNGPAAGYALAMLPLVVFIVVVLMVAFSVLMSSTNIGFLR